jgi:oxygen-dependent protoporphyrinogen oxidase
LSPASGSILRVAILGGGITGLAAAHTLVRAASAGAPVEVSLFEASDRLGGLLQTERWEDFILEGGPDSFLTEKPDAIAFCQELGLEDAFLGSNDAERRTYILHRGRLVPIPAGMGMFDFRRFTSMLISPLFPLGTKLRICREVLSSHRVDKRTSGDDESVADYICRRLGSGMLENFIEPMLAGIYGGEPEKLSAWSALSRFHESEARSARLAHGKPEMQKETRRPASIFTTLREGMGQLICAVGRELAWAEKSGIFRLHLRQKAHLIERLLSACSNETQRPAYIIHFEGGTHFEADAVILALSTLECAKLLRPVSSRLADLLSSIPYNSAVTLALCYRAAPPNLPGGFGFLVPRSSGGKLLACTFVHNKFDFRAPHGGALLRCFLGGARQPGVETMENHELLAIVLTELRKILKLKEEPSFSRVWRWPQAMPQYNVGHADRVREIEKAIGNYPGLFLAGNAWSGVGISDCIRTAKSAANEILRRADGSH